MQPGVAPPATTCQPANLRHLLGVHSCSSFAVAGSAENSEEAARGREKAVNMDLSPGMHPQVSAALGPRRTSYMESCFMGGAGIFPRQQSLQLSSETVASAFCDPQNPTPYQHKVLSQSEETLTQVLSMRVFITEGKRACKEGAQKFLRRTSTRAASV